MMENTINVRRPTDNCLDIKIGRWGDLRLRVVARNGQALANLALADESNGRSVQIALDASASFEEAVRVVFQALGEAQRQGHGRGQ